VHRADHDVLLGTSAASTAQVAHDAGVPGVHLDNPSPGSFRLGKQDRKELAPASVKDAPVEAGLGRHIAVRLLDRTGRRTGHVGDRQVLDRDHVAGVDEVAGGLVVEVAALIRELMLQFGELLFCAAAITRPGLASGDGPLRCG
jgi:hypothetical protein